MEFRIRKSNHLRILVTSCTGLLLGLGACSDSDPAPDATQTAGAESIIDAF
jgi:hypothetical protein